MNNKPNDPEEILPGKNYSFWADMKVNSWFIITALTAIVGDTWTVFHKHCPILLRVIFAVIPPIACLVWIRNMARWIHGMDELHRRIIVEVFLFATVWTLFVILAWERFKQMAILETIFPSFQLFIERENSDMFCLVMAISHVEYLLTIPMFVFFYFIGYLIINSRYK
jgi:hypothetical protein